MKPCAVYIHIPFCVRKCAYCDFASFPGTDEAGRAAYVDALVEEIRAFGEKGKQPCGSIFFGGGTPTLLSAEQLTEILDAVRQSFDVLPDAEITMEANPGTVNGRKLRVLRRAGVNRISLGAQSADDMLLLTLGRIHCWQDAVDAVLLARECGFEDVSLDLMYALPGQSMAQWRDTLEKAAALPIAHISCYSLILEEGTPLHDRVQKGLLELPDEDLALEMHRMTLPILEKHGFARYEISNYCRDGKASRHNCVYWERGDYAGFGCAAHSLVDGVRYANPSSLEEYMAGVRRIDAVEMTAQDALEETLMLTTRMAKGIGLDAFASEFGDRLEVRCAKTIGMLCRNGAAEIRDGRFFLTERGLEVHSYAMEQLVGEWEGL